MKDSSKAKIYLAAERGHTETDWFRSYNSFHFGTYKKEGKGPFGQLYILNDDTLGGGKKVRMHIKDDSVAIILPTVGAVDFSADEMTSLQVGVGQCLLQHVLKDTTVELQNPFESELVGYLQIWIKVAGIKTGDCLVHSFDIEENRNKLVPLVVWEKSAERLGGQNYQVFLGKFDRRAHALYHTTDPTNGIFVFVLDGVFEVQNRLLETRDALALWETKELEFEALSPNAILLVAEIPLTL